MNNKIITRNILIIALIFPIAIKADLTGFKLPESSGTEKLIRWNVIEFGISKGTGGIAGLSFTTLGIDFFFPEYKIGVGTALLEAMLLPSDNMDTPERMMYALLPVKLYVPLYYNGWGPERFKFANTIDLFGEVSLGIAHERPINLNCGIEWCPGLLTNLRIGYARIFRMDDNPYTHDESSIYASLSLFLGAINKLGGGR